MRHSNLSDCISHELNFSILYQSYKSDYRCFKFTSKKGPFCALGTLNCLFFLADKSSNEKAAIIKNAEEKILPFYEKTKNKISFWKGLVRNYISHVYGIDKVNDVLKEPFWKEFYMKARESDQANDLRHQKKAKKLHEKNK